MSSNGMLFWTSRYALEISGVYACVLYASYIYLNVSLCVYVSVSHILICMAYANVQLNRVDSNYRHLYLSYLIFMKWKEQWTNSIYTHARTLYRTEQSRTEQNKRVKTKTGCDISWVQMVIIHIKESSKYTQTHAHTHSFSFIHLFILFDSYCFLLDNRVEWRRRRRRKTVLTQRKKENKMTKCSPIVI